MNDQEQKLDVEMLRFCCWKLYVNCDSTLVITKLIYKFTFGNIVGFEL